jgi:hypothetical protein
MTQADGKVHVVRVSKTGYVDKQGRRRKDYTSAYLRRTYRDGGKVKNETVANLSALPGHVIDWIDAGLKGQQLVPPPARSPSPARCRTATPPPCTPWPPGWGCPPCWAPRAASGTWPWP